MRGGGSRAVLALVAMLSVALASSIHISPSSSYAPFGKNVVVPKVYPLFKQCNPEWANNIMETTTICDVGCLMSSTSMALNGHNITIDGEEANPGTLNAWLRDNGGYTSTNDMYEAAVPGINPARVQWDNYYFSVEALAPETLKAYLDTTTTIVIANVLKGQHFVLVVGYDEGSTNWYVNDPGFDTHHYTYDSIVGWRIFTMTG